MLVADDGDGSGVEREAPSHVRCPSEVGRGEHPEDVPVGKQQDVALAVLGSDVVELAQAAVGRRLQGFPARGAVPE